MSSALFIVAEDKALQQDVFVNGKCIVHHLDHIGSLAEAKGLPRPDAFFSASPSDVGDMMADMGIEEADVGALPSESWFPPAEGLQYFQDLTKVVQDDSCTTESSRQEILADLKEFETAFRILVEKQSRWHFGIDM